MGEEEQRHGRPRDPQRQNQQARDAASAAGLTREERGAFRRDVESRNRRYGENLGYQELLDLALSFRRSDR